MAVYKSRALVPVAETWDIESLLGKKTVDQIMNEALKLGEQIVKISKHRLDNVDNFYEFWSKSESFTKLHQPAIEYLNLACAENTLSPLANKMAEFFMKLQPISEKLATISAEDIKNAAKIKRYLKDDRLANWRRAYEVLFRNAEHVLPESIAVYDAKISDAYTNNVVPFTTLTDAELKYEPALDAKGKKNEVTTQTISTLLRSNDRTLRKNAFFSYKKGNLAYKETLATMLSGQFLANYRLSQSKKYQNQIFESMHDDNVKPDLVLSLYKAGKANTAPRKRMSVASRHFIAKKLGINYNAVEPYDTDIELVGTKKLYKVSEAKKMVLDSVSLLGEEYSGNVQKAFNERWVDFHMTPNKQSGAFSSGIWVNAKKYILTNFNGQLSSVSTLAHEMGHSMHTLYNHKANALQHSSYPLFIAEVASIFSELMLTDHVLKTEKDEVVKFRFLEEFLYTFNGNVFTQLLFSEYEYRIVDLLEKNTPATDFEALSNLYREVSLPYLFQLDWAKKYPDNGLAGSILVPHYYYGFYVYKYAIGMIGALHLMSQVKADRKKGAENYLKFIRSGTQQWPADILKSVGVDLYDQKTFKSAFELYESYVEQYVALGKKLLKVKTVL